MACLGGGFGPLKNVGARRQMKLASIPGKTGIFILVSVVPKFTQSGAIQANDPAGLQLFELLAKQKAGSGKRGKLS